MKLKDHYHTLKIAANASQDVVKKAYRQLAHRYHPDKNSAVTSNIQFQEIQEAYVILSDPQKRKLYDEQRYFSGLSHRKEPVVITMEWMLKLSAELRRHMNKMHAHDINHFALYQYATLILSEEHIDVFQREKDSHQQKQFIDDMLIALRRLHYQYYTAIIPELKKFVHEKQLLLSIIEKETINKRQSEKSSKLVPYIILLLVLLLCFLMYWYGKKH